MSLTSHLPRVVFIGAPYHEQGPGLLHPVSHIDVLEDPSPAQIARHLAIADAAVVRYPCRIDEQALADTPHLAVVASSGRGTDSIDVDACTRRGIAVVNNPGLGTQPVSEHTLAVMLALVKRLPLCAQVVRQPDAWQRRAQMNLHDLHGRTLGIVGLGLIGREVARKCIAAFGMQVLAVDPHVDASTASAAGVTLVDLPRLLAQSDIVSLHCELNDETRALIGEAELRTMQPQALLINTARGKVVQQQALVRALREGWIAAAALDVYEDEPLHDAQALFALDNLLMTPHIAGLSNDALRALATFAAEQVRCALAGQPPRHLVNPHVWPEAWARLSARHCVKL